MQQTYEERLKAAAARYRAQHRAELSAAAQKAEIDRRAAEMRAAIERRAEHAVNNINIRLRGDRVPPVIMVGSGSHALTYALSLPEGGYDGSDTASIFWDESGCRFMRQLASASPDDPMPNYQELGAAAFPDATREWFEDRMVEWLEAIM